MYAATQYYTQHKLKMIQKIQNISNDTDKGKLNKCNRVEILSEFMHTVTKIDICHVLLSPKLWQRSNTDDRRPNKNEKGSFTNKKKGNVRYDICSSHIYRKQLFYVVSSNNHQPTLEPYWIAQKTSWSCRKSRSQLEIYKPAQNEILMINYRSQTDS